MARPTLDDIKELLKKPDNPTPFQIVANHPYVIVKDTGYAVDQVDYYNYFSEYTPYLSHDLPVYVLQEGKATLSYFRDILFPITWVRKGEKVNAASLSTGKRLTQLLRAAQAEAAGWTRDEIAATGNTTFKRCQLTNTLQPWNEMTSGYVVRDGRQLYTTYHQDVSIISNRYGLPCVESEVDDWVAQSGKVYHRSQLEPTTCPSCGASCLSYEVVFDVCHRCAGHALTRSLENYNEKATKHGFFGKGRHFGVELEYESDNVSNSIYLVNKAMPNFTVCKRDGSVSNGLEVVTAPATKDILLGMLEEFYSLSSKWEGLQKWFKPASCTGMHVHIGKGDKKSLFFDENGNGLDEDYELSYLTIGKMLQFMHDKENEQFIHLIAGRSGNTYCRTGHGTKVKDVKQRRERYLALNTQNEATVELRIFASPPDFKTCVKNIDFADALPLFARDVSMRQLTVPKFKEYVKDNRGLFPHLVRAL